VVVIDTTAGIARFATRAAGLRSWWRGAFASDQKCAALAHAPEGPISAESAIPRSNRPIALPPPYRPFAT
jgi:hypothetical protein